MEKSEKLFVVTGICILLLLAAFVIWRRSSIEAHKAYVLAKVTKVSVGGEAGPTLYFYYRYNRMKYTGSMSGFFHIQDSMVFVKISAIEPGRWVYTDIEIPRCLLDESNMDSSWKAIPSCSSRM